MGITVKTKKEIENLRKGGEKLAAIRDALAARALAGVSAQDLENEAEKLFAASGGEPSFFMHREKASEKPFPARICVSVNDAIVHGVPKKESVFKEGDLVGIDVGLKYKGLFTDTAVTVLVTSTRHSASNYQDAQKLLEVTKKALAVGIAEVRAGATTGDIGFAIETYVKSMSFPRKACSREGAGRESRKDGETLDSHLQGNDSVGFGIVRTLCGHGVGYAVHEEPKIPNFGKKGEGTVLKAGMVIAIEPMLTLGGEKLALDSDGFTFRTADGSLTAHFEHTLVVTERGSEVLTQV